MSKVSVIIPTYNVEPYLEECMESVTRQTLKEIEIICINDGSTDGSLQILQEYAKKDSRIILIDKKNEGYGIGVNQGIDMATGKYIGIVEPDDYIALNMYEDLYHIAETNDLDFVKADFYRFTRKENGNMKMIYNHLSKREDDYNIVFSPRNNPKAINYIMNTWSGIYKRSFLNEYEIRHNTTPGASYQDNGFWFQTFIYGKRAMIINKPYYRNRRDNITSSVHNSDKVYAMNIEYDYIRGILTRDEAVWEKFKAMYWRKKYHNYTGTLHRIDVQYKKEYIQQFCMDFKRGLEKDELDKDVFTELEWSNIQFIVKDPDGYYIREIIRNEEKKDEIIDIKNSMTYKVGSVIMFVPKRIRRLLKRIKNEYT
ncbi:MAG: glycosyltransferase [Lachnospiraceae bacterium]|nr:glycosyltransferase [Lachnospiraceae bacterium]